MPRLASAVTIVLVLALLHCACQGSSGGRGRAAIGVHGHGRAVLADAAPGSVPPSATELALQRRLVCVRTSDFPAPMKDVRLFINNIFHQSQIFFPAIEEAMQRKGEVAALIAEVKPMAWTLAIIDMLLPGLKVVYVPSGADTETVAQIVPPECGPRDKWTVRPPTGWTTKNGAAFSRTTFHHLWRRVREQCGISIPHTCDGSETMKVAVVDRHCHRHLVDPHGIIQKLQQHFKHKAHFEYRKTADNATICDQVRWFTGADVYIAAHGSQLTNTIFMPDGALLVEILPWSLPGLRIYRNINNAVWRRWRQVLSMQPTDYVFHRFQGGKYTQSECARNFDCTWHVAANANLNATVKDIINEIRRGGGLRQVCLPPGQPLPYRRLAAGQWGHQR